MVTQFMKVGFFLSSLVCIRVFSQIHKVAHELMNNLSRLGSLIN